MPEFADVRLVLPSPIRTESYLRYLVNHWWWLGFNWLAAWFWLWRVELRPYQ